MGVLTSIISNLTGFLTSIISTVGYPGIFVLMTFELILAPMPSELIMPFAGFLVAQGQMDFTLAVLVGTMGGLAGGLILYYIGLKGGVPIVKRYGKYVFISEHELDFTMEWFKKHGELTILISRFIPIVRDVISIPAGIGKMNIKKFIIFSFIGSLSWCTILTYAGMVLQDNWELVFSFTERFELPVFIILCLAIAFYIYKHIEIRNNKKKKR